MVGFSLVSGLFTRCLEPLALMDCEEWGPILLCELDRATLLRKRPYDAWHKRCTKTEAIWNTKYRNMDDDIDSNSQILFRPERLDR
jgi:hypothetical protein